MTSRGTQLARGSAAAAVSTLVAAVSHAAGGGIFPHPMLLATGFAFAVIVCVALAGRRVSWPRLIASVSLSQLLFHGLFTLAPGSTTASSGGASTGPHPDHAVTFVVDGAATAATAAHTSHSGVPMLLAHIAAAILTVLALRFGESALHSLIRSARLHLPFGSALFVRVPVIGVDVPPLSTANAGFQPRRRTILLPSMRHRGPPALFLAF